MRRSFVYRSLLAEGASGFVQRGEAVLVDAFSDQAKEQERLQCAGIVDLSPLPRIGFKGRGTPEWLHTQGLVLPGVPNQSLLQENGAIVARLGETDTLILGDPLAGEGDALAQDLYENWAKGATTVTEPRGFPLLRGDSHAWFLLSGQYVPQVLAKICGVDLRPQKFGENAVAQTMLCGISAIVIRSQTTAVLNYHLLVDSSFARYCFSHLLAASKESGGGPVGFSALMAV